MIVALPMYDWPEVRPFTEKYWSLIRHHLRAAGFEVPEDLTEPEDYFAHWRDPDLLLSQTCGLPFSAKLSGHVSLIGPVDHGLTGCAPGEYQSHVIIRADEDATSVEDLRGRRFGFNSRDSQSGHAAFVAAFGSPDALFGEMVETGGHRASVLAVAEGRADAAAIDAVGWQLAMAHEPAAKGLRFWPARRPPRPCPISPRKGRKPRWRKSGPRLMPPLLISGRKRKRPCIFSGCKDEPRQITPRSPPAGPPVSAKPASTLGKSADMWFWHGQESRRGALMSTDQARVLFRRGIIEGLPFNIAGIPFAMLFGVVAYEAGFDITQVLGMSFIVMAGASSLTALHLLGENAPALVAVVAGAVVNLRMMIFSAALAPHLSRAPLGWRLLSAYCLADPVYVLSLRKFELGPRTMNEKLAYYFGVAIALIPFWYLFCWIGALIGKSIPPEWPLDFAGVIMFTALAAPSIRGKPAVVAAVVASITALFLSGLPWSIGLILAALSGMSAGAFAEWRREVRNAG